MYGGMVVRRADKYHKKIVRYYENKAYYLESLEEQRERARNLPPTPRLANIRKIMELSWQLIQIRINDQIENLFTNYKFLEAKVEGGKVYDLLRELVQVRELFNNKYKQSRILLLLEEAISFNALFLNSYPTTLFQCMWNICWWYDCDMLEFHCQQDSRDRLRENLSELNINSRLCHYMEKWRADKENMNLMVPWFRSLRPPRIRMGSALIKKLYLPNCKILALAFSNDNKYLASLTEDNSLSIWELSIGENKYTMKMEGVIYNNIKYSSNGEYIYLISEKYNEGMTVDGFDLNSYKIIKSIKMVTSDNNSPNISLKLQALLIQYSQSFHSRPYIVYSNDQKVAAIKYYANSPIEVRDANSGKLLACFRGHKHSVQSMVFSNDNKILVSGANDRTIRVWDVESGVEKEGEGAYNIANDYVNDELRLQAELNVFNNPQSTPRGIAINYDNSTIACGGEDGVICVWDLHKKSDIVDINIIDHRQYYPGGEDNVDLNVRFTNNGEHIISSGLGYIVWSTHREIPIAWTQITNDLNYNINYQTNKSGVSNDEIKFLKEELIKAKNNLLDVIEYKNYYMDNNNNYGVIILSREKDTLGWLPGPIKNIIINESNLCLAGVWRNMLYMYRLEDNRANKK